MKKFHSILQSRHLTVHVAHIHTSRCKTDLPFAKSESSSKLAETQCMGDHQVTPEHLNITGELAPLCAQVVLTRLSLASIGNEHSICWQRLVTQWNNACGIDVLNCTVLVNGTVLNCTVLNGIVLNGIVLNCIVLNGIVLNCIVLNCIVLNCIVLNGIVLNGIVLDGIVLNGIALNGIVLNGIVLNGIVLNCTRVLSDGCQHRARLAGLAGSWADDRDVEVDGRQPRGSSPTSSACRSAGSTGSPKEPSWR